MRAKIPRPVGRPRTLDLQRLFNSDNQAIDRRDAGRSCNERDPTSALPVNSSSILASSTGVSIEDGTFNSIAGHLIKVEINTGSNHGECLDRRISNDNVDLYAEGGLDCASKDPCPSSSPHAEAKIEDPRRQVSQAGYSIYYRQLAHKKRGLPLWFPQPSKNLPIEYQRSGTQIGDVGIVTSRGDFIFFFNICYPADHPINRNKMPANFLPVSLDEKEDVQVLSEFGPRSYLSSSSIRKTNRGVNPGLVFESSAAEGAILAMPAGSTSENLIPILRFQKYAARHAEAWYRYVIDVREYPAGNGDIRLVIGNDKTSSWGIATFSESAQQDSLYLSFRPMDMDNSTTGRTYSYGWEYTGAVEVRAGPDQRDVEKLMPEDRIAFGEEALLENQCLFVRTVNIRLADKMWKDLASELGLIELSGDETLSGSTHLPSPTSRCPSNSNSSPFSTWFGTASNNYEGRCVTTETDNCLSSVQPHTYVSGITPALLDHPSDILNYMLLRLHTDAKIAVTSDDQWMAALMPDDSCLPPSEELLDRVMSHFLVEVEDGILALQKKSQNIDLPNCSASSMLKPSPHSADALSIRGPDLLATSSQDLQHSVSFFAGVNSEHCVVMESPGNYDPFDVHYEDGGEEQESKPLRQWRAADALHDSSVDILRPACHPNTRHEVIDYILKWLHSKKSKQDILWLYGPLGGGKSAILQTIAELCCSSNRNFLAASFFFLKGKAGRDDERQFIITIAYQMALVIPDLKEHVMRAMFRDPALHTKDIWTQLRALIIGPLQRLLNPPSQVFLVVIDGLDACQVQPQEQILECITMLLEQSNIRLRFLVASRPEVSIRAAFEQPRLNRRTTRVSLDRSWNPDRDIRIYLEDGFADIVKRNSDVFSTSETSWPAKETLDLLVEKSSGHFIFPATVLNLVGDVMRHPVRQLDIVLNSGGTHSAIDDLYTSILQICPYPQNLSRVFSLLLAMHCPQPLEVFADLLDMPMSDVSATLRGLHSLIEIPSDKESHFERYEFNNPFEYDQTRGLRLHHATFRDYLLDRDRCQSIFLVDLAAAHSLLVKAGSELMLHWISLPWSSHSSRHRPCRETWGYLKHHMGLHLDQCEQDTREQYFQGLTHLEANLYPRRLHDDEIWIHSSHALQTLVTGLAETAISDFGHSERQLRNPANFQSEHSHWTKDTVLSASMIKSPQAILTHLHGKFRILLDEFYKSALASSNEDLLLLESLPGFINQQTPVLFDWLKDICDQDADSLSLGIERAQKFVYRWNSNYWTHVLTAGQVHTSTAVVAMNSHFAAFLSDPSRAGHLYSAPQARYLHDLCQILKTVLGPGWLRIPRQQGALEYLDNVLKTSFDSILLETLEDTVALNTKKVELLDVMSNIKYDISALETAPVHNVDLIWSLTRRLLDWIHRQISSRHISKRQLVCISDRIYGQILEIDTLPHCQRVITIRKPFVAALSRSTGAAETRHPSLSTAGPGSLTVSDTLLALHGLRASLTPFLTNSNRAGDLFLPPALYHTHMAEICLNYCNSSVTNITQNWKTIPSHTEWRFHLQRASASKGILETLECIPFGLWLAEGLPSSDAAAVERSINSILDWLKRQPPAQTANLQTRWQDDYFQHFKLRRRKAMSMLSLASSSSSRSESGLATPNPSLTPWCQSDSTLPSMDSSSTPTSTMSSTPRGHPELTLALWSQSESSLLSLESLSTPPSTPRAHSTSIPWFQSETSLSTNTSSRESTPPSTPEGPDSISVYDFKDDEKDW